MNAWILVIALYSTIPDPGAQIILTAATMPSHAVCEHQAARLRAEMSVPYEVRTIKCVHNEASP